jgi:hypothetical protein
MEALLEVEVLQEEGMVVLPAVEALEALQELEDTEVLQAEALEVLPAALHTGYQAVVEMFMEVHQATMEMLDTEAHLEAHSEVEAVDMEAHLVAATDTEVHPEAQA